MCLNPIFLDKISMPVRCGKCLECSADISREWSYRLSCELSTSYNALFITLTYADEYLSSNNLIKRDLQLYLKRLRKKLQGRKIKYFACGEYGNKGYRPHYHLIIFNVTWSDSQIIIDSWNNQGIVDIAPVETGSLNYVAGYVNKKIYDDYDYELNGFVAPFRVMSKNLGKEFCLRHYDQLKLNYGYYFNGKLYPFPRYYRLLLGFTSDNEYYMNYLKKKADDSLSCKLNDYNIDFSYLNSDKKKYELLWNSSFLDDKKVRKELKYEKYNNRSKL